MPAIIFHLHGKSAEIDGISVDVQTDHSLDELRKTVAAKFSVALPTTVSFHKSAAPETTASDLEVLAAVDSILKERTIAILVSGKKVRPIPGPTGGIPFIGGYSEIYPDFIGNYQRLLQKYGHIVHVSYLGKSIYLTDDPDCAGVVLSEGEFYSKEIGDNHPLFPLKMSIPNGLFTADSSNPSWSTSHKFMMTAMGAKAMRNYVRTMDSTARRLVHCFDELLERGKSFDAFPWALRAAGQTIGEVAVNVDLKMLDNADTEIANIFQLISTNLRLAQTLFRKGRVYRALPNPEKREQRFATAEARAFVDKEAERILRDGHSSDMPIDKAAVSTTSLLDYMLHATDEEGRKMDVELVHQNVITFLGAGQVTTSSGLAWLWFCLATFPVQARKLYASLIAAGLRKDKEISAEELGKLEYLDWFIKETQRLYNPAFQPTRQAQKDVIMPGGLLVPKGSQVTVALHSLMINPEYWKDPLTFDPERWGTEAVRRRHRYAYLPFAAGGRGCIGFNFALQEIKLVISRVVLNFQIENTTEGPVIYDPDFSLYRPLNLRIRLHKQLDPEEVIAEGTAPKVEEKVQAPQPAVGAKPLPRLWAVHASNNGTCEGMAGDVAAKARQLGFAEVHVVSLGDSPLADPTKTAEIAAGSNFFLICVATYNGEPPDSALSFSDLLDAEIKASNSSRFAGINFCIFGAGNTQWGPTFQAFPKKVDANLAALGGNRVFEKGTGDSNGDQDAHFTQWTTRLWAATAANFGVDINGGATGPGNVLTNAPDYHADSVKVEFVPHPPPSSVEPFVSQPPLPGFVGATLRANIELVDEDTPMPRGMRLLNFDVPNEFTYREGDHMEVFPENDAAVVDRLLVALNFVADAVFKVKEVGPDVNPTSLAAFLLDRGQITLRELLLYYADLVGPLHRSGLMVLFSFLPDNEKFKDLRETLSAAGAASDKAKSFTKRNSNFSELIANYPILAQVLDLQKLLMVLRATQPRRYSIACSPLADPRVAKLCVGVDDPRVTDHQGLCSSFLARAQVGHIVWVRARSAQDSFHLPNDPTIPVIMVAAGTGISAFLGFLEHRQAQGIKVQEHGGQAPFRLFYGTSYHDMSSLRSLIQAFADDGTVLVEAAYSEEDSPRRFAQHILIRDALKIWSDLSNNGRVYVCGSATRVGQGVRQALMQIAVQIGGIADPAAWFAGVKKEGRYSEDVFG